jgi:prevent-host-death family protein
MEKVSVAEARGKFSEVIGRAAFGRERIVVERRGKPIAAVVPIEDLQRLEELEDQAALAELLRAKRSAKGFVTLEEAEGEYLRSRRGASTVSSPRRAKSR